MDIYWNLMENCRTHKKNSHTEYNINIKYLLYYITRPITYQCIALKYIFLI